MYRGRGELAGAAGGVTAGARSGRGNDGSGGRRCGWRREGGGVGDAADGSFTTPYNILKEGGVGQAGKGKGSMQWGAFGHGGISPGLSAQEGARKSEEDGKRKETCPVGADRLLEHGHIGGHRVVEAGRLPMRDKRPRWVNDDGG